MCLLLVAHDCCDGYRLIIAANRDEYHERPTSPASIWTDDNKIIGGRDKRSSGTWLAVDRYGRFATITNVPLSNKTITNPRSRGLIVNDFLKDKRSARQYTDRLANTHNSYEGFNILVYDSKELAWYSNSASEHHPALSKGIYTLSNASLDTCWPKTERLRSSFQMVFENYPKALVDPLFDILRDKNTEPSAPLSQEKIVGSEEKSYSSIFIEGEVYGTRCSTVITIDDHDQLTFNERRYNSKGEVCGESQFNFELEH